MSALGTVVDNAEAGRFEMDVEGHTAFAEYRRIDNSIVVTHTEVPRELRGRGVGQALARGVLDTIRAQGADVIPLCPFLASFIRENREYLDMVSVSNRRRLGLF